MSLQQVAKGMELAGRAEDEKKLQELMPQLAKQFELLRASLKKGPVNANRIKIRASCFWADPRRRGRLGTFRGSALMSRALEPPRGRNTSRATSGWLEKALPPRAKMGCHRVVRTTFNHPVRSDLNPIQAGGTPGDTLKLQKNAGILSRYE